MIASEAAISADNAVAGNKQQKSILRDRLGRRAGEIGRRPGARAPFPFLREQPVLPYSAAK